MKGIEEKNIIKEKILKMFPEAFLYNKEIRIPINDVQIKITLTCAKVNVESGDDIAIPGAGNASTKVENTSLSSEEITEVRNLIDELNL